MSPRGRAVRKGISKLYPRLWRYCVALTGSREHADDLAQTACLRAIEKSALYDPAIKFAPWMFRLTQRLWINEVRKNKVRTGAGHIAIEDADLIDPSPNPEASVVGQDVWREVMSLPEAQRSTVFLVYVEGHSYREAADIIEIPVGTVMSRLAAARKQLSHIFSKQEEMQ
nr:RNA polymerase sigma factor [Ahrensia sp. R2A130]